VIDLAGAVAARLRGSPELMAALGGNIFAEHVPTEGEPPYVLVTPLTSQDLFTDVDTWETSTVLVEAVGRPAESVELHLIVSKVLRSLKQMRGTSPDGVVVQAVGQIASAFGIDPGFSPALPRWVLTVPMTVRSVTSK
jgi:hypothetical protein